MPDNVSSRIPPVLDRALTSSCSTCRPLEGVSAWLADAGYTLSTYVMVPFDMYQNMPRDQRTYNYLHSKTRIVIECAFGMLKERFRIFKTTLNHTPVQRSADIVVACMVLHNILIDLQDDTLNEETTRACGRTCGRTCR